MNPVIPYGGEIEKSRQIRMFRAMVQRIHEQEKLIQMIEQEKIIPEMAQDLAKKAINEDILGNKKSLLELLYNIIANTSSLDIDIDVEFHYIIIEKKFMEVDMCSIWIQNEQMMLPFEIGEKFGEKISGTSPIIAPNQIIEFYKQSEKRFDRELLGNLERCSLLILEEKYPQSSYHITLRLPVTILNEFKIEL